MTRRSGSGILGEADVVYFLMFPGWEEALRSNRWHFATRWAARLPVVLLQPARGRAGRRAASTPEPRIANCRILRVHQPHTFNVSGSASAVSQVLQDLDRSPFSRPLLWTYNPFLLPVYAAVPAVARVYHATENYFDFAGVDTRFRRAVAATVAASDLTVAVSAGVADGIRAHVPGSRVDVVTNGCDYATYASAAADPELVKARARGQRTAVFAGNINGRLDFGLLATLAQRQPELLIALFGPVHDLSADDHRRWDEVRRAPNVREFGEVAPDRLPGVYHAADIGLIPYKTEPWLVTNGFPLKALEMCATGLPVVSTRMESLVGLTPGLAVAGSETEFVEAVGSMSRASIGDDVRASLHAVAKANDYDLKFAHVLGNLDEVLPPVPKATTRIDIALRELGGTLSSLFGETLRTRGSAATAVSSTAGRVRSEVFGAIGRVPRPLRAVVPRRLRRAVVRRLREKDTSS